MVGAHQIAFALHHGHWADKEIDHADTDGLNNTPDNLREATPAENGYNVKCRSNTGVKGVSFSSVRNSVRPYQAMLRAEGKIVFSKEFATLEEATVAIRAARELHHGEFCNHG
jgi:hypothetical protein